jgi:lipopolysaccharide export system permease protein
MKKVDKLVLDAFIGPFLITFLVVVFILLNINMLKYFDDIIGKGLDTDVLAQLFFYFAIFTIPTALPLAVLLSSLISFGNLGEHFELTAIKSAGISLVRVLVPIFCFVIFLTVLAFYANNNLVPKAALEAYSLLYDIKQKKPALDLREGAFYYGINDINIKVNKKFPDGVTLKDVIIYDHRKNDGNKDVIVADSGKMYTILNERYLKFELFNGYNYTEGAANAREVTGQKGKNSESLTRSKFTKSQFVFDLSSFQLQRTDKQWFQGNRMMRNMRQLDADIDSMQNEILSQRLSHFQYKPTYFRYYLSKDTLVLPPELVRHKQRRDSLERLKYMDRGITQTAQTPDTTARVIAPPDTLKPPPVVAKTEAPKPDKPVSAKKEKKSEIVKKRNAKKTPFRSGKDAQKAQTTTQKPPAKGIGTIVAAPKKKILSDSAVQAKIDSLFQATPDQRLYQYAANAARQVKSQVSNANAAIDNYEKEKRVFEIQWHKIIASSFACIAMFLIGAPLGAIIKRGGLGVPFLVSILFFIVYYVLTMQGEKLAKQGSVSIIAGVWLADAILFAVGLFFLRQARSDARLFEADFYNVVFDKVKVWASALKSKQVKSA